MLLDRAARCLRGPAWLLASYLVAACAQPGAGGKNTAPQTADGTPSLPELATDHSGSMLPSSPAFVVPRLGASDVFFAMAEEVSLYESMAFERVVCKLRFGDQLLIRERGVEGLKLRLDLFALNDRSCPLQLSHAFVKASDDIPPPAAPPNELSLEQDHIAVFAELAEDEPFCILNKGAKVGVRDRSAANTTQVLIAARSCGNTTDEIGYIKELSSLPLAERYQRTPKLSPYTLAHDLKVYSTSERMKPALCTLAKGNFILTLSNNRLQMPAAAACGSDSAVAYFEHFKGLWLEEHPQE